jgi:peptidylprolyl isomerase
VKTRSHLLPVLAAAALALSACGDGGEDVASAPSPEAEQSCPNPPTSTDVAVEATDDLQTKPEIEVPEEAPPAELQVSDVVVGEGDLACSGDTVSMQYVGVTYADGKQFDASWDRGEPFTFQLGGGQVIGGWDQGIVGMKQGGRRTLVIPPDLGYGDQGAGPDIPPGATLVFVVDLVGIGNG